MTDKLMVVSAAVSQKGAVFYTTTGEAITVPVTNYRVTEMVDKVVEAVKKGQIPVEVDLTTYSVFTRIEEESKGLMRFFRVPLKKIKSLLGRSADRDESVKSEGFHNKVSEDAPVKVQPGTDPVDKNIRSNLQRAHTEAKKANLSDDETTIVAVVGDTPIVGVEVLQSQAQAAVSTGETIGFQTLMTRLGAVAAKRKHTVQEALAFLKEMDLPFANDGSIIAYKSLRESGVKDVFIDNHSGKLQQGLGTYVEMDAELVDDNRRTLCSNGLHVARRGYLGGYGTGSSNVVCLIKIAPEEVISVPLGEQSKMRVRAYHIVAVLSQQDKDAISRQKSFTVENMEQASLLAKVIRGDHVGILNRTTQHKGVVDQMVPVETVAPQTLIGNIQTAHTVDIGKDEGPPMGMKAINDKLIDVPATKHELRDLRDNGSSSMLDKKTPAAPKKADVKKVKAVTKSNQKAKATKAASKKMTAPVEYKAPIASPTKDGSEAFVAYNLWQSHKTSASFDALMALKKKKKKSWAALGLAAEHISIIEKALKAK